ncbi:MAG TPA: ParA family protein [Opitutaceae bacterium]|nr:ParA family protein [Opitutaceae bacterium]
MPDAKTRHATAITIINLKGGVGKTHTTWLLASVCQERGLKVLVIDTDTQANFTSSFLEPAQTVPGVERLFHPGAEQNPQLLVRRTRYPHIDVLPSSSALARFDLADQREWERADLHLSLVEAIRELRPLYDYVLIDCPPRLSLVSFASLCASDGVIIPMEAADWGAQGIMQVTAAVEYVQQRFNPPLRLLGYLVSRFKRARSYQQSYLRRLREHFGALAFDTVIPDLAQFEKSVTDRVPISLHAPRSEEAAIARAFFDEFRHRAEGHVTGGGTRRRPGVQRPAVTAAG